MIKKEYNPSKKRMKALSLVLFAFLVWAGFTIYHQWIEIKEIRAQLSELEQSEAELINTKKELEKKINMLQDKDYIAELARKYYFLSKPGEIIIISPDE